MEIDLKNTSEWIIKMKKPGLHEVITAILFSLFSISGYAYINYATLSPLFSDWRHTGLTILIFVLLCILFCVLVGYAYQIMDIFSDRKMKSAGDYQNINFFKSFRNYFVFLVLCYLPYLIICFPGNSADDTDDMVHQFFGLPCDTMFSLGLDPNGVIINNIQPVFHTFVMGGCIKLGMALGSANLGVFIYDFFQMLMMCAVLSLAAAYLRKSGIHRWICGLFLLYWGILPIFPMEAIEMGKDTSYTCWMILIFMIMIKIVESDGKLFESKKVDLLLVIALIFYMVTKRQGMYVAILAMILLLLPYKKYWKRILLIFLSSIFVFSVLYSKVLLPALDVKPGSIRSALSIPWQQTARYLRYYPEDLTDQERESIDKILDVNAIGDLYEPDLYDAVKDTYKRNSTKAELLEYFKTWVKCGLRHPGVYIEATLNNTYGYYYPLKHSRLYMGHLALYFSEEEIAQGFDFKQNTVFEKQQEFFRVVKKQLRESFPLNMFDSIGLLVWINIVMIGWAIKKGARKELLIYLFPALNYLVCYASPANANIRYALFIFMSTPLLTGSIYMNTCKRKEICDNENNSSFDTLL